MKKLIKIYENDPIPDNSKFIESREERGSFSHSSYSEEPYGFFWVKTKHVDHYNTKRVYIYEVEEKV